MESAFFRVLKKSKKCKHIYARSIFYGVCACNGALNFGIFHLESPVFILKKNRRLFPTP